jgi:hypothetical protein
MVPPDTPGGSVDTLRAATDILPSAVLRLSAEDFVAAVPVAGAETTAINPL